jgi:hypothetical protein
MRDEVWGILIISLILATDFAGVLSHLLMESMAGSRKPFEGWEGGNVIIWLKDNLRYNISYSLCGILILTEIREGTQLT